jgi:hypothetical protein
VTRRERLERKLELRREWADKAKAKADSHFNAAHKISDMIPMGQPILIGHHSERHHRRDLERIDSNMRNGIERSDMAANHISKAGGIEHALDRSIFSDDANAIEALQERIAEHEAEREKMKLVNKLYRKGDAEGLAAIGIDLEALKAKLAKTGGYWGSAPHLPYEMSNLGGRIAADKKRLEIIKQRQARSAKAEESPNGVTLEQCQSGYVRVTFAEKPAREILNALRGAGFFWGNGSWAGKNESLPQEVKNLLALPEA